MPIAIISQAFGMPTPHWRGVKDFAVERVMGWVAANLPMRRRKVSPTATGRIEPSFFFNGKRDAAHRWVEREGGMLPRSAV